MVASLLPVTFPARSSEVLLAERVVLSRKRAEYDAELVKRFKAGDESAFVEIVQFYRARMFGVAMGVLKNRADAEEISQDAFIRAHRCLENFRGDSSLAVWLHCIALNLARNRYWYFFRRRRHLTDSLDLGGDERRPEPARDRMVSTAANPARQAVTNEFAELVARCMAQLGDRQRDILTQRTNRNLSYHEIARDLGIRVGTVKSRIARARLELRALLAKACPEFGRNPSPLAWFEPARPIVGEETICA